MNIDPNLPVWIALNFIKCRKQGDASNGFMGVVPKPFKPSRAQRDVENKVVDAGISSLAPPYLGVGLFAGIQLNEVKVVGERHLGVGTDAPVNSPTSQGIGFGIAEKEIG